ncbi:hypothetical protein RchiOBHm_Chr7g0206151 [Rosa chinensis]|uniref:Uncharacterized protein n=1 Tax=Rosa chinensis TaxID=74649 RepID=A0A2P6P946_ROSCH|nr:hypothetical protein RchiOBHm_Chr7g0206151 [Rosa chinensis]
MKECFSFTCPSMWDKQGYYSSLLSLEACRKLCYGGILARAERWLPGGGFVTSGYRRVA